MTTSVEIKNLNTKADEKEAEEIVCVKAIDREGNTESTLLSAGQKVTIPVYAGRGFVVEAVSTAAPPADAVVLTDSIETTDGVG